MAAARLSHGEIDAALVGLPGWIRAGDAIQRTYVVDGGFRQAVAFVSRLAGRADEVDHHPDVAISWNRVTVTLSTHSAGGVTGKDVALARDADALAGA